MKEILRDIYNNSYHKIKKIQSVPNLENWINNKCNSILWGEEYINVPSKELIYLKIYSISRRKFNMSPWIKKKL